jgi:hypothetical protein
VVVASRGVFIARRVGRRAVGERTDQEFVRVIVPAPAPPPHSASNGRRAGAIIDVQVIDGEHDVANAVAVLERKGYAYHRAGGVPGREYLTWRAPPGPLVNVHVFGSRSATPADDRMIRDFLRAHPERAEAYARTKQRAIDDGHLDLRAYSHAEQPHVEAIRDAARAWAGQRPSQPAKAPHDR